MEVNGTETSSSASIPCIGHIILTRSPLEKKNRILNRRVRFHLRDRFLRPFFCIRRAHSRPPKTHPMQTLICSAFSEVRDVKSLVATQNSTWKCILSLSLFNLMCIASASNVQYFKSGSVFTILHFTYQLLNGPSKLECFTATSWKACQSQFVSPEENEVLRMWPLSRPYEDIFEEIYSLLCKLDHFCAIMKRTNFLKFGA